MGRSAESVLFGFDFQTNAAIVLMLENLISLETLRLEGMEDIELKLEDGSYILAQAKAVVKSSSDFSNVRKNAKKAFVSLSEASTKVENLNKLIYITNSPDPFKDNNSRSLFCDLSRRCYDDLPKETKDIIDALIKSTKSRIDLDKLKIMVVPFETDDEKERYKIILREIADFLGDFEGGLDSLRRGIHSLWKEIIYNNGTSSNHEIKLSKKDLVWPIIVFAIEKNSLPVRTVDDLELDESEFQEVQHKYKEIIDTKCEKFEFVTKIVSDYEHLRVKYKTIKDFVNGEWNNYIDEVDVDSIEIDIKEPLIKVVLYGILNQRFLINSIKKKVKL